MSSDAPRDVGNFGGNVSVHPAAVYAPRSEEELLEILRRHRGESIRVMGSRHSWSPLLQTSGVLVDLMHLDTVQVEHGDVAPSATVGAGCTIRRLVAELLRSGFTTRSLGLIMQQTIAGASATGTHGSGRNSLSHYITAVRIAHYEPATGQPQIVEVTEGEDLRAARCSLGCLGIVTGVRIAIRERFQIEEHFRRYNTVAEVVAAESEYDLQQFFLVPWNWNLYAQHRREVAAPRSWHAPFYRLYWALGMDVAFHLIVLALARVLPARAPKIFYRSIMPWLVPRGWKVVDRSDRQLTMHHELFRHIEIEMFVPAQHLEAAIRATQGLLEYVAGDNPSPALPAIPESLQTEWTAARGIYRHHYPICVRKVLPDDTLISMSSSLQSWYALSFISYARPDRRQGFFQFATLLCGLMAHWFGARPHWGKWCPLTRTEIERLYPDWNRFREIAGRFDPSGRFRGTWLDPFLEPSASASNEQGPTG